MLRNSVVGVGNRPDTVKLPIRLRNVAGLGLRASRWRLLEPKLLESIERIAVPAEPALGDPRRAGEHILCREAFRSILEDLVIADGGLGLQSVRPHAGSGHRQSASAGLQIHFGQ